MADVKDRFDINNKYYLPQLIINSNYLSKSHIHYNNEKPLKLRLPIYHDNIKIVSNFIEYSNDCNIINQPYDCYVKTDVLPYCIIHTKDILKLEVKESTIPNAGNGLFAINNNTNEIVFNQGDIIYKMEGEILNQKSLLNRYGSEYAPHNTYFTPYAAQLPTTHVIDATIVRGVCALANDPRNDKLLNTCHKFEYLPIDSNSGPKVEIPEMLYVASKPIREGEEIFISYGKAYWEAFERLYKI